MSTKKEPYQAVVDGQVYFTIEDTKRILKETESSKVKILKHITDDDICEITDELQDWASWYEYHRNSSNKPSPKGVKKTLEDLQKKADKFQECLRELDDYTKYFCLEEGLSRLVNTTKCYAEMISDGAKKALEKIENPGNPQKPARKSSARINFIARLVIIYKKYTGRNYGISRPSPDESRELDGPYVLLPDGPYVRFVNGCLKQVGDDVGRESIAKSIRETRNRIKKLDDAQKKKLGY